MAVTREEIIEALKEMSLLEASELVKDIEETFGVSAAAPVAESPQRSLKPISLHNDSGYSINSYLSGTYSVFSIEKGSLYSPSWRFSSSNGR